MDDWIQDHFVKKLHRYSETVVVFDCCHSGTLMDLPYQYETECKKCSGTGNTMCATAARYQKELQEMVYVSSAQWKKDFQKLPKKCKKCNAKKRPAPCQDGATCVKCEGRGDEIPDDWVEKKTKVDSSPAIAASVMYLSGCRDKECSLEITGTGAMAGKRGVL